MTEKQGKITLFRLFYEMFLIAALTFGGGFVIIGMMQKRFCEELHWVSDEEVLDMTAIAQSAPGALAVNSAVIFGYRIRGLAGALTSVLAAVLPSLVIISVITLIYSAFITNPIVLIMLRVMRAGVAAVIVDVVIGLAGKVIGTKDVLNIILMIAAFIASWFLGVSAIAIILFFLILGFARSMKMQMGKKDKKVKKDKKEEKEA